MLPDNPSNRFYVPGEEFILPLTSEINLSMAWCPFDVFVMGSSDNSNLSEIIEKPQHNIKLDAGFWIGKFLITQEQWLAFMSKESIVFRAGTNLPVTGMCWLDARTFCNKLIQALESTKVANHIHRIDLPSEAQWEYACRAGTQTEWYFGNDQTELEKHAWYEKNSNKSRQSIGNKLPNPWGVYDLYGNVSEWCLDSPHDYNPIKNGISNPPFMDQNSTLKVVRGGNFLSPSGSCRSASREFVDFRNSYNDPIGLRIVCT